jgi:hypothetical protein
MIGAVQCWTVLRGPRLATGSDGGCWEYGGTSGGIRRCSPDGQGRAVGVVILDRSRGGGARPTGRQTGASMRRQPSRVVGNRIRDQARRAMEQQDPDALPEQ